MASFTKRNNSWRCTIRCKGHPTLSKTFPSKALAQRWALDTEQSIDCGSKLSPSLRDCLIRYAKEISPLKKGCRQERSKITAILMHSVTSLPIDAVKPSELAMMRDDWLKQGKKPATVRLRLLLLSHVYTTAMREWGLPLVNPVSNIRKPSVNNARTRRLEGDELERILSHCSNEMRVWVIVAIETGMRRAEQYSLTGLGCVSDRLIHLSDTKNGDERIVPLSTKAVEALVSLPGLMWRHSIDYYSHEFARICKLEGITGLRMHDLRREGVSRLFEKGLNMFEVKAISGHKTTKMLERYVKVKPDALLAKLG